jgi:hypothetical protein
MGDKNPKKQKKQKKTSEKINLQASNINHAPVTKNK